MKGSPEASTAIPKGKIAVAISGVDAVGVAAAADISRIDQRRGSRLGRVELGDETDRVLMPGASGLGALKSVHQREAGASNRQRR